MALTVNATGASSFCIARICCFFNRNRRLRISSTVGHKSSKCLNFDRRTRKRRSALGFGVTSGRRLMVFAGSAFAYLMSGQIGPQSAFARQARSEIEQVLKTAEWPEEFPFKKEDFARFDESPDDLFYSSPRFVTHIDDPAINALTKFYESVFPPSNTPGVALLDMCSSWVSHYPKGYKQEKIIGMGMNEEELKRNPVLTSYIVQDLNVKPNLPFEEKTFDVITNAVRS